MDWECFSQMIKGRCVFDSYVISSLMIITVTNARILIRYHEHVLYEYLLDMQSKRHSFVFRQFGYFNLLACYRTGSLTHGFQLVLFSNKLNYSASFSPQTCIFVFSVLGAISRKPRARKAIAKSRTLRVQIRGPFLESPGKFSGP